MASTKSGENANLNKKFSFTKFFMSNLKHGFNIFNSFESAHDQLGYLPEPWKSQVPQIAGDSAGEIYVGGDFKVASSSPVISSQVMAEVKEGAVQIEAVVSDLEGLNSVWSIVVPPDFQTTYEVEDFSTPNLTGLPSFEMALQDKNTGTYGVSTTEVTKSGEHQVIVYALDTDGNIASSEPKTLSIGEDEIKIWAKQTFDLVPGWNLLGLAIEPDSPDVDAVLGPILDVTTSVWKWKSGNWAVHLPQLPQEEAEEYRKSKGFSLCSKLQPGEGFWLNLKAQDSLSLYGTMPSETNLSAGSGWNLLAFPGKSAKSATEAVQSLNGVISLWKWKDSNWSVCLPGDENNGQTYAQDKGFSLLKHIEPGEGFWVNCQ